MIGAQCLRHRYHLEVLAGWVGSKPLAAGSGGLMRAARESAAVSKLVSKAIGYVVRTAAECAPSHGAEFRYGNNF